SSPRLEGGFRCTAPVAGPPLARTPRGARAPARPLRRAGKFASINATAALHCGQDVLQLRLLVPLRLHLPAARHLLALRVRDGAGDLRGPDHPRLRAWHHLRGIHDRLRVGQPCQGAEAAAGAHHCRGARGERAGLRLYRHVNNILDAHTGPVGVSSPSILPFSPSHR
ncbi:unnamed protein product, partial [Prorocentrum cordatum]